jgi:prepilin-type N-terminal cleavage/methylation domain-containing protein
MKIAVTPSCSRQRGFTLIELLVVIGIIAVVTTIIGLGLSRGSNGTALAAAQTIVMSQFAATRAQAALRGENAALVVVEDINAPSDSRRVIGVAVEDAGIWRLISDPVRLPGSVGVVDLQSDLSLWRDQRAVAMDVGSETTVCWLFEIAPNGALEAEGGGEIWLRVGQQSASGWQSSADAPRRGIRLSRYGAVQPIEETAASE